MTVLETPDYVDECIQKFKDLTAKGREFYYEGSSGTKYLIKGFDEKKYKLKCFDDDNVERVFSISGYDFKNIIKNIKPLRVRKKSV